MSLHFFKYQGAGNDFIILDHSFHDILSLTNQPHELISALCHRRFGIGADGLMILEQAEDYDFKMKYYNADGYAGTMCGNGGRCLVAFAHHQNLIQNHCTFLAVDGPHKAHVLSADHFQSMVSLQMTDVRHIQTLDDGVFMDTGSPHFIKFADNLSGSDIEVTGSQLRHDARFGLGGTNVNFVNVINEQIHIRTYERGVESETLACGTGIVAAALAAHHQGFIQNTQDIPVKARGGELRVSFQTNGQTYHDIFLVGPAVKVFQGQVDVKNFFT